MFPSHKRPGACQGRPLLHSLAAQEEPVPNPLRWTLAGLQGSDLPPPPGSALGSGSPSSLPWSLLAFRLRFCPAAKENGVLAQNPLRVGGWGVAVAGKAPDAGEWGWPVEVRKPEGKQNGSFRAQTCAVRFRAQLTGQPGLASVLYCKPPGRLPA